MALLRWLLVATAVAAVCGDLCATTGLNGRTGASTGYPVVCTMWQGDRSKVAGYSAGWYLLRVETGPCAGRTMYSHGGYLTNCGTARTECVTATWLNVREGPSTAHGVVTVLQQGTQVSNLGEYAGWAHITGPGVSRGFVSATYLAACAAPPPVPVPVPGTGTLPPPPDTSGNRGTCRTTYDGHSGYCITRGQCTGGTFNDLCPAGYTCCVAETQPAYPQRSHMSLSQFNALFENLSGARAGALLPYFNEALDLLLADGATGSVRCHRLAAFAAQVGYESVGLLYFEEIASGAAYEGRCSDLGNCFAGDGMRYKGRGPIQLTGRANYRSAGTSLGKPFEAHPELVNFPSGGFKATSWYWMNRGLNAYATGNANDFITLTIRINGGTNGLAGRQQRWGQAKSLLGC